MSKFDVLIACRINEILDIKSLDLKEACLKANISYQALHSFIEFKRTNINYKTILKLCQVWGITISMFFDTENFDILT